MSDRPTMSHLNWEMLERLRTAVQTTDANQIKSSLLAEQYDLGQFDVDFLDTIKGLNPNFHPPVRIPMEMKVDAVSYAEQTAQWLVIAGAADRLNCLIGMSVVGDEFPLPAPHFLILSYFSELFRFYALGIEGEGADIDLAYDGDMAVLRACGGLVMPGHLLDALYDPTEVSDISNGLNAIVLSDYPKGDVRPLRDYYEDASDGEEHLDEVCKLSFGALRDFYQAAAGAGLGVRILG
ncbi:hypothetical protein [Litoreibacter janthinus]|uniref:Uncharacterized protein n=1 Tax=Litoreibacter janthinus TaxID=670154 RepID=A0A1I6GA39_9RHOB|nr:hypothetical protein [Litoreibacter janthinus]SFR39054.1 hypothetical protein SAMN04488002_1132 [Litoreibacter janthinus]